MRLWTVPDISRWILGEGVVRTGQNLDNSSRVICLKHIHPCRVNRLLKAQLNIILAVEALGGAGERWRGAGTLFPPRPIRSEQSRLGEVPRAWVDVGYARQVPHGVGHAVLAAIVGAEVQNLLGVLLHLHTDWQHGPLAGLHRSPTGQGLASGPTHGASPQTNIVKHSQDGYHGGSGGDKEARGRNSLHLLEAYCPRGWGRTKRRLEARLHAWPVG